MYTQVTSSIEIMYGGLMSLVAYGAQDILMVQKPIRVLDEASMITALRKHFTACRIQKAWDAT